MMNPFQAAISNILGSDGISVLRHMWQKKMRKLHLSQIRKVYSEFLTFLDSAKNSYFTHRKKSLYISEYYRLG
jgi:hypothetical protein